MAANYWHFHIHCKVFEIAIFFSIYTKPCLLDCHCWCNMHALYINHSVCSCILWHNRIANAVTHKMSELRSFYLYYMYMYNIRYFCCIVCFVWIWVRFSLLVNDFFSSSSRTFLFRWFYSHCYVPHYFSVLRDKQRRRKKRI